MLIACCLFSLLFAINGAKQRVAFIVFSIFLVPAVMLFASDLFSAGGLGAAALNSAVDDFSVRLSPAREFLATIGTKELFFGNGFGTYFVIPWFKYRNMKPELGIIDSIHYSLFVKFGLSYIILYWTYLKITLIDLQARLRFCLYFYFSIMGVTVAFLYRPGFILVAAALIGYGLAVRSNAAEQIT